MWVKLPSGELLNTALVLSIQPETTRQPPMWANSQERERGRIITVQGADRDGPPLKLWLDKANGDALEHAIICYGHSWDVSHYAPAIVPVLPEPTPEEEEELDDIPF